MIQLCNLHFVLIENKIFMTKRTPPNSCFGVFWFSSSLLSGLVGYDWINIFQVENPCSLFWHVSSFRKNRAFYDLRVLQNTNCGSGSNYDFQVGYDIVHNCMVSYELPVFVRCTKTLI